MDRRRLASEAAWATLASVAALALVAKLQGGGALQPLNATSHWLNGEEAAQARRPGWRTTGVGLLTHAAATGFWALFYDGWLGRRPSQAAVVGRAAAMAGIAAVVDYRATPRRFTPGWEFVLTPAGMAVAHVAMAAGFAAGARRRP